MHIKMRITAEGYEQNTPSIHCSELKSLKAIDSDFEISWLN